MLVRALLMLLQVATFIWKHTFPLSVDGVLILPLIAYVFCSGVRSQPDLFTSVLITIALECIADITATCGMWHLTTALDYPDMYRWQMCRKLKSKALFSTPESRAGCSQMDSTVSLQPCALSQLLQPLLKTVRYNFVPESWTS